MSSANGLTPAERQALKGRAHKLAPVVWIGGGGLTESLVGEVGRALAAHALIKIQALHNPCSHAGGSNLNDLNGLFAEYEDRFFALVRSSRS